MEVKKLSVSLQTLHEIGCRALKKVGVPEHDASTTIEVLLGADLHGIDTHGIQRLPMYISRIRRDLIKATPDVKIEHLAPSMSLVSGDNGLGPLVAFKGLEEVIRLTRDAGLAFVGCRDSNHLGAMIPYLVRACEEKFICIGGTNAFTTMAPWGGLEKRVGNNPLGIGVPGNDDNHFLLDIAMSVSSRGRIRALEEKGEKLPENWAVDSDGNPTTDPLEALKGFVLPMGGHKGYGLAVAVDILSGVLTGAGFSTGVKSIMQQSEEPQHIGHFFLTLDPARFMEWDDFTRRSSELYDLLKNTRLVNEHNPVIIPGEPEIALARTRKVSGIPIPESALAILNNVAAGIYDEPSSRF